jgi:glycosyltransferase involved in cell wall biosynthesis
MTAQLVAGHPDLPTEKFLTLTNGFDPDDFACVRDRPRPARPVLFSYLGSFYSGRNPVPFLEALRALIDSDRLSAADVRVHFGGDVAVVDGQSLEHIVDSLGLTDVVSISTTVPRQQALELACASHVLLTFTGPTHLVQRPVKLYEALASGAQVLHIGPHGDAAQFLSELDLGVCASGEKRSELEEVVLACVERGRRGGPPRQAPAWRDPLIAPYAFSALTAHLAAILSALPARPGHAGRR